MSRVFIAADERTEGHTHVLLLATGSVAAVKVHLMVERLLTYKQVRVVVAASTAALTFIDRAAVERAGVRLWTDVDEWTEYKIGDPILHIELRRWPDVVLIAPCSANTLAKLSHGVCDTLVTSVARALAPTTPTFVFPAMNTFMYEHPLTAQHLQILRGIIGYSVIGPIAKTLACGDTGVGAMVEWTDIVQIVADKFQLKRREDLVQCL